MPDPLAQFKQGPNIEKPKTEENLAKDKEYLKPLKVSLEEQKRSLKNSLYGVSNSVDLSNEEGKPVEIKEGIPKETESKEVEKLNVDDLLYAPVLNGLLQKGHIDSEQFSKISEQMINSSKEEGKTILEKEISQLSTVDDKEKELLIKSLSTPEEVTKENFEKTEFFSDFQDPETLSKPEGNELDLLLAENYIKIPEFEGESHDKKANLEMTMNIVLNKIIDKQSIDFKHNNSDLIGDIRNSDNVGEMYKNLQSVLKQSKVEDAKKGTRQNNAFKNGETLANKNSETLQSRFQEFKERLKLSKTQNDNEKLEQLIKEGEEIQKEAEESEGEIFIAGDLDIMLKDLKNENSEQKEEA